jgi:aspartyl-tRNA(Asn)/glutamyl-tRNA(Gln) amidotransferase subunit A
LSGGAHPAGLSARELLAAYRERTLSPVEVVDALLERIAAVDAGLGAFTTLRAEAAREEAVACERDYGSGAEPAPLAGVPFAVKDLFDTAGLRTTYGSPMFADHVPSTDAAAVRQVRAAGGILVGKTQTHEFAWGITSVNELMGTSRNPWDPERISGGSSGGSAVALAAGHVPIAIGSDTGGSIRVPSAFCGTVGHKPTYGRVSTEGVWPLAPSLDHPGPMARTPADAALLLSVMDDPAHGLAPRAVAASEDGLAGLRIGVCRDLHLVPPTSAVQAAFDSAVGTSGELGAEVVELSFPRAAAIHPAFVTIQATEALDTHRRARLYPERRQAYGADVRGRLERAEELTPADYVAATAERERLRSELAALFRRADILLTPVGAGSPPRIGEEKVLHAGRPLDFRQIVMPYTVPQDLFGLPACTVRAGFDELGIPVGVQFTAPPWGDVRALGAAQALFDATPELQARGPELGGPKQPARPAAQGED